MAAQTIEKPAPSSRWHFSDDCNGCGTCRDVCPHGVLKVVDKRAVVDAERKPYCFGCGQCAVFCAKGALTWQNDDGTAIVPLGEHPVNDTQVMALLESRRSIRLFSKKAVDQASIDRVVAAASTAPMGFPPHTTKILVVQDENERAHLAAEMRKMYAGLINAFGSWIGRTIMRWMMSPEMYKLVAGHVIDIAKYSNDLYEKQGVDRYCYSAPVVMLFYGNRWSAAYEANAYIAATHAMLGAHAMGLGTTMIDLIPPAINRTPALKARWGLEKDDIVVSALVMGWPKYKPRAAIRRKLAGVKSI